MLDIDHLTTKCTRERLVTKMPAGAPPVISKVREGESLQQLVERHEAAIKSATRNL